MICCAAELSAGLSSRFTLASFVGGVAMAGDPNVATLLDTFMSRLFGAQQYQETAE
jgi:hypothetical protein